MSGVRAATVDRAGDQMTSGVDQNVTPAFTMKVRPGSG
jgi:hypothetical protein